MCSDPVPKAPKVKRVVLTSSIAAVLALGKSLYAETVVDETWFSSSLLKSRNVS